MAVDTSTTIAGFDTAKPALADPKLEGAANFQHVKTVLKTTFPAFGGACTASHTEVSYLSGVTSSVQTQINGKGSKTGQVWTGAHSFSGATITVPVAVAADQPVTKAQAEALAFAAALPAVSASTKDLVIGNDGITAFWRSVPMVTAESLFLTSF